MNFYPTHSVSILRGESTDGYGDPVDTATAVSTGVPVTILEQTQNTNRPDSDRPSTVRLFDCRLPATETVQDGDRIKDEADDTVYIIDTIAQSANPARTMDWRLVLRRIT